MTRNMYRVKLAVNCANAFGRWHRAQSSGQRVTLAALYRRGELTRRIWRKGRSSADDAHEYANPTYLERGILR